MDQDDSDQIEKDYDEVELGIFPEDKFDSDNNPAFDKALEKNLKILLIIAIVVGVPFLCLVIYLMATTNPGY
jgi:hypothetical protein